MSLDPVKAQIAMDVVKLAASHCNINEDKRRSLEEVSDMLLAMVVHEYRRLDEVMPEAKA